MLSVFGGLNFGRVCSSRTAWATFASQEHVDWLSGHPIAPAACGWSPGRLGVIQESIQEIRQHWTDWAALDGLRSGRNRTSEHWSTPAGREEEFHNPSVVGSIPTRPTP